MFQPNGHFMHDDNIFFFWYFLIREQIELTWTAPGEILDYGKVDSYSIFTSELSTSFYKRERKYLKSEAATKRAGGNFWISSKY